MNSGNLIQAKTKFSVFGNDFIEFLLIQWVIKKRVDCSFCKGLTYFCKLELFIVILQIRNIHKPNIPSKMKIKSTLLLILFSVLIISCEKDENILIPIQADFNASDTIIEIYDTITFTNLSENVDLTDSKTSYTWYFQDGYPAKSTDLSPAVVYKKAGVYSVRLVTKNMEKNDSITKSCYIRVKGLNEKGLVSYYPFNGSVNDLKAYNKDTAFGGFFCSDENGKAVNAYSFSILNKDRIRCGADPISNDSSLTISLSIYPESDLNEDLENEYIISSGAQTLCVGYYMIWKNGQMGFGRHTNHFVCDTLFGQYEPLKWYKVAMTYNCINQKVNIYVNGKQVVSTTAKSKEIYVHKWRTLSIGEANNSYLFNNRWTFNGVIDQVRIYNRVLTEREIQKIYLAKL